MKSQQEAERAEQQRIKNLVLNYDLSQDSADQDGTTNFNYFFNAQTNLLSPFVQSQVSRPKAYKHISKGSGDSKPHNASLHSSSAGNAARGGTRGAQRSRKLQLSDVDWYENSEPETPPNFPSSSSYTLTSSG